MYIDNLTKSRTLLRCTRCKGTLCWWDHETDAEQEERIRNYKSDNPAPDKWTKEELEALHKPIKREWTEKELEELV